MKTKCSTGWNDSSLARISSLATLSLESLKANISRNEERE
jgi:hypothetical protein